MSHDKSKESAPGRVSLPPTGADAFAVAYRRQSTNVYPGISGRSGDRVPFQGTRRGFYTRDHVKGSVVYSNLASPSVFVGNTAPTYEPVYPRINRGRGGLVKFTGLQKASRVFRRHATMASAATRRMVIMILEAFIRLLCVRQEIFFHHRVLIELP